MRPGREQGFLLFSAIQGLGIIALAIGTAQPGLPAVAESVDPATAPPIVVFYRPLDLDRTPALRSLSRTSLLTGRTEFVAVAADRDRHEIVELRVLSEVALFDGRRGELCRSKMGKTDTCAAEFGSAIRGHRLTLVVRFREGEEMRTHVERVATLRAHADPVPTFHPGGGLIEKTGTRSHPPDHVTRLVRVVQVEGRGQGRRYTLAEGLTREHIVATAAGIDGVEVLSVQSPQADATCVVPFVWNVTPYLKQVRRGLVWTDDHATMVRQIRKSFSEAANAGYDCESFVVEYASSGRPLYGPFRLHSGKNLMEPESDENQRLLDALERHLLQDPIEEWGKLQQTARAPIWDSDFLSIYHTLNDLLRGWPGLKSLLLLTDGNDDPSRSDPVFQEDLWPGRIEDLNASWQPQRVAKLLHELDFEATWYDIQVAEFVAGLDPDDADSASRIAAFVAELDPGALSSLHTHRKDIWPPVHTLIENTGRIPRNRTRLKGFLPMVGGTTWALAEIWTKPRGDVEPVPTPSEVDAELTIAEALLEVARHIRQSYVVDIIVPNPSQDARSHELGFKLRKSRDPSSSGVEFEFMPSYYSSPPLSRKLPIYASSPFKLTRLLAAYDFRDSPLDDRLYGLLRACWPAERDEQVRRVLFESWISIQLQRLQVGPRLVPRRHRRGEFVLKAYANLTGLRPEEYPDPRLAADAKRVAEVYRAQFPEKFPDQD